MHALRARVVDGRLVMNEPTTLPEGAEVDLMFAEDAADEDDDLDEADRAELHAALDIADDELRAGKWVPGEEVIARLRRGDV